MLEVHDLIRMAERMRPNGWVLCDLHAKANRAIILGNRSGDRCEGSYFTAEWTGEFFVGGNYDLSLTEARADLRERSARLA